MLVELSCKYNKSILLIIAVLTCFFGYHAAHIRISADMSDLIPENRELKALTQELGQSEDSLGILVIAVERDDPFTLEGLQAFSRAIDEIQHLPGIMPGIHPFNFLSFEKKGSRLSAGYLSPNQQAPETEEELARFRDRILSDPFASTQIISRDHTMLAALFPLKEIADLEETTQLYRIIEGLKPYYKVSATGDNLFTARMSSYLFDDLKTLLILAGAFILIFYFLSFRSRRAMLLPLALILISIIWCLGFMSLLDYSITLINIILPPLLLTIGSSYSVHILNGFYREARPGLEKQKWIAQAVSQATKTVILAGITTIVGFSSLLVTSICQTRQFGISMSFGICACIFLSLSFLPAALTCLPPPKMHQKDNVLQGRITRWMEKIGLWVITKKKFFLSVCIATLAFFFLLLPNLQHQSDYQSYFPKDSDLIIDTNHILTTLGSSQQLYVTFDAPENRENYFRDLTNLADINTFEERLLAHPDVVAVDSFTGYLRGLNKILYGNPGMPQNKGLLLTLARYFQLIGKTENIGSAGLMMNADYSRLTCIFRLYNHKNGKYLTEEPLKEFTTDLEAAIAEEIPEEIHHTLWGSSLQYLRLSEILNRDQGFSIALSSLLIFLISSFFFRSFTYGFVSLIPIIFGVMVNFIVMVITGIPLDMITLMVSSVTVGVGVDDAIHFLIQFKHQRTLHPDDSNKVFFNTFSIAGRPILLTSVAIVGGLCVFLFSNFLPIKYFGFLLCLTLLSTLMGTLFIVPAFCLLFYRKMS